MRSLPWGVAGLALAAALAAGLLYRGEARIRAAQAETIARLEAQAEAQAEALAVHRAHRARLEAMTHRQADLIRDLADMEGANAELSDYLRRAAGRVWGP